MASLVSAPQARRKVVWAGTLETATESDALQEETVVVFRSAPVFWFVTVQVADAASATVHVSVVPCPACTRSGAAVIVTGPAPVQEPPPPDAGFTVTVALLTGPAPPAPVHCSWYVWTPVVAGVTESFPEAALPVEKPVPVPVHEVALLEDQVSTEESPSVMVVGDAESEEVGADGPAGGVHEDDEHWSPASDGHASIGAGVEAEHEPSHWTLPEAVTLQALAEEEQAAPWLATHAGGGGGQSASDGVVAEQLPLHCTVPLPHIPHALGEAEEQAEP